MKKFWGLIVAFAMVFSLNVTFVHAADAEDVAVDVATADELIALIADTVPTPVKYKNLTVNITADIDLTDKEWTSGFLNGYCGAETYTIDGQGHTITGLTDSLFGSTWAGNGELYIKNLTIADSVMSGGADSKGFAAFLGHTEATPIVSFENCHLKNCTITGADWTGGFIGYAAGYSNQNDGPVFEDITLTNCTVEGCTITGAGSTGAIIGHATGSNWTKVTIDNCKVLNNTVKCTDDSDKKAGSVMGTVGVAGAEYAGKQGGIYVNAEVKGNTVTSNDIEVKRIYGRFGSAGVLTITGGTYIGATQEEFGATNVPDTGTLVIQDGVVIKDHVCTATKVDAVESTCTVAGNIEHWACLFEGCGKLFGDEAMTTELTTEDVMISLLQHTQKTVKADDATCVETGYTGDVVCSVCSTVLEQGKVVEATGVHIYLDGKCTMCQASDPDYKPAEKVEMGTTDTMEDTLADEAASITGAIDTTTGKLSEDIKVDEATKEKIEEAVAEAKEDNSVEINIVVEQVAIPVEENTVPEETTLAIEEGLDAAKQEIAENSTEDIEGHGIVQYLDLSVLVKAHNVTEGTKTTLGELKETKNEMEFTITVPDEYLKPGYEVFVLRYHVDGEGNESIDKLPLRHVEGNRYAFSTNKFSSYALAYVTTHVHTETVINAVAADCGNDGYTGDTVCAACGELIAQGSVIAADGNHHWSEWKNQEGIAYTFRECWGCGASEYLTADTTTDAPAAGNIISTPATGDTSNVFAWVSLMVACCGVVLSTMVYRKNR